MKYGGKESTALAVSLAYRLGEGGGWEAGKTRLFPSHQISVTELCVRPSVSDPYKFFTDPDPDPERLETNTDLDTDPDPDPGL